MTWSNLAHEAVARFVAHRTGLAFVNRHDSAELGIRRAMARARVADVTAYLNLLATDSRSFDDLLAELTVGETYFFREPGQFAFLRREVLPDLRRRRPGHLVRAWSAACASGEEAYSLAMLFEAEGLAAQSNLLATDISRAALARAWRATYGAWSLRGPGATAALPYLRPAGKLYQVDEQIRRRVTFQHLNLALDVYPSFATGTWGLDLILCRNVLIYFDRETVRGVARRLFGSLIEGGWLLTASSDPPLADDAPFETVVADEGIFYRRPVANCGAPSAEGEARIEDRRSRMEEAVPLVPPQSEASDRGTECPALRTPDAVPAPQPDRAADPTRDAASAALHIRALANRDTADAERACAAAVKRHALAAELGYLHAVLLLELGRGEEAAQAARRVLYLDRTLALGHFTLGSILQRGGDLTGARRAYRNARDLCATCPPEQVLPLSDGEHAGRLAEAAEAQLAVLEASGGSP